MYSGDGYTYANYTIEELKEIYAQSGNEEFLDLEVVINGQTYIVQVESYLFPELFEQL